MSRPIFGYTLAAAAAPDGSPTTTVDGRLTVAGAPLTVSPCGTAAVVFTVHRSTVAAYFAQTGAPLWTVDVDIFAAGAPVLSASNSGLLLIACNQRLAAVRWSVGSPTPPQVTVETLLHVPTCVAPGHHREQYSGYVGFADGAVLTVALAPFDLPTEWFPAAMIAARRPITSLVALVDGVAICDGHHLHIYGVDSPTAPVATAAVFPVTAIRATVGGLEYDHNGATFSIISPTGCRRSPPPPDTLVF